MSTNAELIAKYPPKAQFKVPPTYRSTHATPPDPSPSPSAPPPTYAPPPTTYAPPPQNYAPPPQNYTTPPPNYAPPPQNYGTTPHSYTTAPPPAIYGPPPQNYAPPHTTYAPPPQNYAPPQNYPPAPQSYPPPPQNYAPPPNSYAPPPNSYAPYPPDPAYAYAQTPPYASPYPAPSYPAPYSAPPPSAPPSAPPYPYSAPPYSEPPHSAPPYSAPPYSTPPYPAPYPQDPSYSSHPPNTTPPYAAPPHSTTANPTPPHPAPVNTSAPPHTTTPSSTTPQPTTPHSTTPHSTTPQPTTPQSSTSQHTTSQPTTSQSTTSQSTISQPTTSQSTTNVAPHSAVPPTRSTPSATTAKAPPRPRPPTTPKPPTPKGPPPAFKGSKPPLRAPSSVSPPSLPVSSTTPSHSSSTSSISHTTSVASTASPATSSIPPTTPAPAPPSDPNKLGPVLAHLPFRTVPISKAPPSHTTHFNGPPPSTHPSPTPPPSLPPKTNKHVQEGKAHEKEVHEKVNEKEDEDGHAEIPDADVLLLENGVPSRILSEAPVHFKKDEFHFGDLLHIELKEKLPSLQTNNTGYLLTSNSRLYLIRLSVESSNFTHILEKHSGFYQPVVETPKELVGENEYTQQASSAAVNIQKGGTVISQGMIKGATYVGIGIKKTSTVVIENTEEGHREVTEEERQEAELREKRTATFLSGARMVTGGIGKGAKFVGEGISKAHNKVKGPQEEETTENAQKKAAIGVGGAAANAFGSIVSGVCESAKIIGSDVKDSAVEVKRHREGDDAAEMTEKQFNTAGQATVGTIHAATIVTTGTVKVAIKVGAAAATYDNDWKRLMEGAAWKKGWLSSQDETLGPWVTKRFVLRSYALAIYKDKKKDRDDPMLYIPTLNILTAEKADFSVTKKALCFKLVTKSGTFFFSVECPDKEKETRKKPDESDVENWIDVILGLARVCDGSIE